MGIFDRLSKRVRIAVVGDTMRDVYVHGELHGCQDDCPKFMVKHRIERPGGALNADACLAHWPNVAGELFRAHDRMSVKTRFMANGKIVWRHDEDHHVAPSTDCKTIMLRKICELEPAAILISDYAKGTINADFVKHLVAIGCPVIADCKQHPRTYDGTIMQFNEAYADRFPDFYLADRFAVRTNGHRPPSVLVPNQWKDMSPLPTVPCVNHVGAGDCFAAHLALAIGCGIPLDSAAQFAYSAGRVYVQHMHNRAPWPHEIHRDMDPVMGKVVNDVTALRASLAGKRVVATNGVYRIPHAGHTWLFDWAKRQGDVLVVFVNDDASAMRCKSGTVLSLAQRVQSIAACAAVDWIVVFTADTPAAALEGLRPDVLVKGADTEPPVPGTEFAGELQFAPESPFPYHATDLEELFVSARS